MRRFAHAARRRAGDRLAPAPAAKRPAAERRRCSTAASGRRDRAEFGREQEFETRAAVDRDGPSRCSRPKTRGSEQGRRRAGQRDGASSMLPSRNYSTAASATSSRKSPRSARGVAWSVARSTRNSLVARRRRRDPCVRRRRICWLSVSSSGPILTTGSSARRPARAARRREVTPSSRQSRRSSPSSRSPWAASGSGAVAVDPLAAQVVELVQRRDARQAAIRLEARVVGLDVVLGQVGLARARRA